MNLSRSQAGARECGHQNKQAQGEHVAEDNHPLDGLAISGGLWWTGAIILYAPEYLQISGGWIITFMLIGLAVISISFMGALIEFSKLLRNEGFSYIGVGLVFGLPAIALFVAVQLRWIALPLNDLAKIGAMLLAIPAGFLLFMGFVRLPPSPDIRQAETESRLTPEEVAERKAARRKTSRDAVVSLAVTLLSLGSVDI